MEKSIEKIWNESFFNKEKISIPKINNLYNQKSKSVLDKIESTIKKDLNSLIPIAVITGLAFAYKTNITLGLYIFSVIILLFFFNKNLIRHLKVNITLSNYNYLIAYKKAIQKITSVTNNLLAFGLPIVVILGLWLFFKDNEKYQSYINSTSNLNLFFMFFGLFLTISSLGLLSYKISTNLLYGKLLKKLNEIILDIEKLSD